MKVYLAGMGGLPWHGMNFYNFYRLDSILTMPADENPHRYKDFILDSGIFSYLNSRPSDDVDWEKYVDNYAKVVVEKGIRNYVEVDADAIIGLAETERLRARLEKQVGWKSMPVWHTTRGYDKWLEICRDYDYICIAGFASKDILRPQFKYLYKFLSDAHKYNTRVHGLGFTNMEWLPKLKFYSVDSSSWVSGSRYGHMCKYENGKVYNTKKPQDYRVSDVKGLSEHNFKQWLMFCEYADVFL